MKLPHLTAILLLVFTVYGEAADQRPKEISYNVSIIRLIACPEKYDGKRVTVRGFLRLGFEDIALYMHREDYERSLLANSIYVSLTEKQIEKFRKYDRQYVVITGVFTRCDETQFVCPFSGHIREIGDHVDFWPLRPDESGGKPRGSP